MKRTKYNVLRTVLNIYTVQVVPCLCNSSVHWISFSITVPLSMPQSLLVLITLPLAGRYWETVERIGITQFYGAPTALRLLLRYGDEHVKRHDRSSLRVLGSVGEPINPEAWRWYNEVVGEGKCTVVDTWWQTGEKLEPA